MLADDFYLQVIDVIILPAFNSKGGQKVVYSS